MTISSDLVSQSYLVCFVFQDWSDLIEYVINTFIKKPHSLQSTANIRLDFENFDDDFKIVPKTIMSPAPETKPDTIEAESDDKKTQSRYLISCLYFCLVIHFFHPPTSETCLVCVVVTCGTPHKILP